MYYQNRRGGLWRDAKVHLGAGDGSLAIARRGAGGAADRADDRGDGGDGDRGLARLRTAGVEGQGLELGAVRRLLSCDLRAADDFEVAVDDGEETVIDVVDRFLDLGRWGGAGLHVQILLL